MVDSVAKLMEQRREEVVPVPVVEPTIAVKVLFVGPFVYQDVLERKAKDWKLKLEKTYSRMSAEVIIAEPPFETVEMDCKGYWLKPEGRTYEKRVKDLKSQISSALISLLILIERHRPRILLGEGQGGTVVAMSTFPIILERSCRDRAVTQEQMLTFRQAWSGVTSVLVVDPTILLSLIHI